MNEVEFVDSRNEQERESIKRAAIFEHSRDAIIYMTLDGLIVDWNQGAELLFGYSKSEVLGQSVEILTPSGQTSDMRKRLESIRLGACLDHYTTKYQSKAGQQVCVSVQLSGINDATGKLAGVSSVSRDISALIAHEEHLMLRNDQLGEQISQLKSVADQLELLTQMGEFLHLCDTDEESLFGSSFASGICQIFAQ